MTNPDYTIPGGMLCTICGLRYFNQSMGGPGICPGCDCGNFGAALVQRQGKEIERLSAALQQCNEHRDSPHNIIGIVDAALAGMPPYDFERIAHEPSEPL